MRLRILTTAAEARLRDAVEAGDNLRLYRASQQPPVIGESETHETRVELASSLPLLQTLPDVGQAMPSTDAGNARLLHGALRQLQPVQASDRRLWASLCHGEYWSYVRARYPRVPEGQSGVAYVHSHWFVTGSGLASLRRNAIARLWWAAHLTYAPWDLDPALERFHHADRYHYTNVLLSSQQLYQDVLEREFGSNLRLRICLLDGFAKHQAYVDSSDELIKFVATRLNLALQFRHLQVLSVDDIERSCTALFEQAVESLRQGPEAGQG